MNTEGKFQEIIEIAKAAGLHTVIKNNEVTVYLVSTEDFESSNVRPPAVRAIIRQNSRRTIGFSRIGTRTRPINRAEAIYTLTNCTD